MILPNSKVFFIAAMLSASFSIKNSLAQSHPHPLKPDIQVEMVKTVPPMCSRIEIDPLTGNIFYIELGGKVHRISTPSGITKDTVLYTTANHHVTNACGMAFRDSLLFIVGNESIDSTKKFGLIVRGKLKTDGSRAWDTVAITQVYPAGNTPFDHGFGGIAVSVSGDSLFICSGSRSDHGEEENNGGLYPGVREVPLTSAIFRISSHAKNLFLSGDSALLAPYIFADGLRNTFDIAFNTNGDLIGGENSGERDDPDELNWIRYKKFYGFPWVMGGDFNPQQYAGYNPDNDIMLNKNREGYKDGYFYNDPSFPAKPAGLAFTPGISNFGKDADYFRDSITGKVMNASDFGTFMNGVTPHRSPLGLVFDVNKVMKGAYKGDGFMVSFEVKGDSAGNTLNGTTGTIVDSSQDLVQIHMVKNQQGNNYLAHCTRIVGGFFKPVDACISGNIIYVLEYSNGFNPVSIWKVTMPSTAVSISTGTIQNELCPGKNVSVPFVATGTFNPSNVFTAQLSGSTGSFSSPLNIGSISSTSSGVINGFIPAATPAGTGYRIRIISSDPAITGTDNGNNLTILCPAPSGLAASNITSTSAKLSWQPTDCATSYQLKYKKNGESWITINTTTNSKNLNGLSPSSSYQWKVRTKCVANPKILSPFSPVKIFSTAAFRNEFMETPSAENELEIYPNPFSSSAMIRFTINEDAAITIAVYNLTGSKMTTISEGVFKKGTHEVIIPANELPPGMYFLQMKNHAQSVTRKIVIE